MLLRNPPPEKMDFSMVFALSDGDVALGRALAALMLAKAE